ncbi:mandelate racemase/muconate lactonizing enzyme family protein [Amycolatopsis sp. NPDC051903]|uniref:mandelate racemase/muconate lactonizing enzyme family protein n=1 Tax=Amycolatopsis sp. NPDC051903 TaxID=3363936 RepID=UPI0037A49203
MTTSKISSIDVIPFRIPLKHEVKFATGRLTHAEHLLVRVRTADGAVGLAEAIPRPMIYGETGVSIAHVIDSMIAPAAQSLDLLETEELAHRLRHLAGNPTARGAVELAMFDALGKTLGVSCHELLGGYAPQARVTAILGAGTIDEVVAETAAVRADHGITSYKVKVGLDLDRDVRLVTQLREQHPDALIYVDANHGYSAADATTFLDATKETRLAWIEEPCPAEDVLGRADVVAKSAVPVLGDESCTTPREVATEILARRCTMISIKLARTGIRASTRIREFCAAVGAQAIAGSQGDSAIGTYTSAAFAAANPVTAEHPAELAYLLNLDGDLVTSPPEIRDGVLRIPDGPGFGFAIDEDALARFRTDRPGERS